MTQTLDGVRLKIDRAQKHLDEITAAERQLQHSPECRVVSEKSADGKYVTFVLRLPSPDPILSLMVGDCVHNLRTALDHLIYAIAEVNASTPRTDKDRRDSMFPICLSQSGDFTEFDKQVARGRLKGIPLPAVALIKTLQPTHRDDPLWVLSELENIDKHRRLTLVVVVMTDFDVQTGVSGVTVSGGRYYDGDGLFREDLVLNPGRWDKMKMEMKLQSSLLVAFQELPASNLGISAILQQGLNLVRDTIIPALEPFS